MPCQVSAQSVVANSRPLAQGSEAFGGVLLSTVVACANASIDEKKRTAATINFAFFTFPPK
jgi:hypothetical protein